MKTFFTSCFIILMTASVFAQKPQFVTYKSLLRIMAEKDGEKYEWENQNISVSFNYENGDFIARLTNDDFLNQNMSEIPVNDSPNNKREFTLEGKFPIDEILNQQQERIDFKVELQLNNKDLDISTPILFDMQITKPQSGDSESYRIFTLFTVIDNDEFQLPSLIGFDNMVNMFLMFNGMINVH